MRVARWLLLALPALLLVAGAAPSRRLAVPAASARPDFSGTWKLDLSKSVLGKFPAQPRARTDVIAHRGSAIREVLYLELVSGPDTTVYQYVTDSSRCVNKVAGSNIEARVWWEGKMLRLESKSRVALMEMSLKDRWTLSPDGAQLTMARHVKYPFGEGDQKLVFERVPPPGDAKPSPKAAPK